MRQMPSQTSGVGDLLDVRACVGYVVLMSVLSQYLQSLMTETHNLKVAGSNPAPATNNSQFVKDLQRAPFGELFAFPARRKHCESKRGQRPAGLSLVPARSTTLRLCHSYPAFKNQSNRLKLELAGQLPSLH